MGLKEAWSEASSRLWSNNLSCNNFAESSLSWVFLRGQKLLPFFIVSSGGKVCLLIGIVLRGVNATTYHSFTHLLT